MKAPHLSRRKKWCLVSCLATLLFLSSETPSAGQCSAATLSTRTYDTLLTGIGYGNYTINTPQLPLSSGLLLSVKINASVSLHYSFTLTNADVSPSIYTILVGRYDQISSPAMSAMYTNTMEQSIGSFPLNPGASVSQPPFAFLQNYVNTDSLTSLLGPFSGSGSVSFAYAPITYTDVHTNNNSSYSYSAAAIDSIHFSVTYLYCSIGVLASSLIRFTAAPEGSSTVQLSWTMANETGGGSYEVQQSADGLHFTSVAVVPSDAGGTGNPGGIAGPGNANYDYTDRLPAGAEGKWYFRLKIDDGYGGLMYSDIKEITIGSLSGIGLRLYPDPATDFVNIDLSQLGMAPGGNTIGSAGPGIGGWQIELFSADGRMLQRALYPQSGSLRLNFGQALAPGAYFIRATDRRTEQNYTRAFLVR